MKKFFSFIFLFIFLTSALSSEPPKWINNPDMDNNFGAVGIVKEMKNKRKRNYIAKKLAIASLQERKRVLMESKVEQTDSDTIATIKQSSSHFNDFEVVQKAEYSDGENYYVWVVVKK